MEKFLIVSAASERQTFLKTIMLLKIGRPGFRRLNP
jgi:hypothetical protein